MNLKEARSKNKLAEFIREHEKKHPKASKTAFKRAVSSMALRKKKSKQGT